MSENKNLSNCTLPEFLRQVNRIRHATENYFNAIDIQGIRQKYSDKFSEDVDMKSARKNFVNEILDKMLEENAEKTVEIIGMACFKAKDEAMQMSVNEAFGVVYDCLSSTRVMDFFISAVRLGLTDTENISQILTFKKSNSSETAISDSTS